MAKEFTPWRFDDGPLRLITEVAISLDSPVQIVCPFCFVASNHVKYYGFKRDLLNPEKQGFAALQEYMNIWHLSCGHPVPEQLLFHGG